MFRTLRNVFYPLLAFEAAFRVDQAQTWLTHRTRRLA